MRIAKPLLASFAAVFALGSVVALPAYAEIDVANL